MQFLILKESFFKALSSYRESLCQGGSISYIRRRYWISSEMSEYKQLVQTLQDFAKGDEKEDAAT